MTTKAELVSWLKSNTARRVVLVEVDGVINSTSAIRRNLLTYTEQFDNAVWSRTNPGVAVLPVITANAVAAPDGTTTADRVQFDCGNVGSSVNRSGLVQSFTTATIGVAYKVSIWIKATDASNVGKTVRLATDSIGSTVHTLTANWTRVEWGGTAGNTSTNFIIECRGTFTTQTADCHIWGAQLEVGIAASNYQRVVDATNYDQTIGTQYFANRAYGTTNTDYPANIQYSAIVTGGVTFSESMDLEGRATIGYGDIELDNTTGALDAWLNWSWANKPVRVYIGDASWSKAEFYQIFSGFVADIDSKNRTSVNLILADRLQYLNVPVTETLLSTVSGNNLSAQAQQNPVPLCFGECFNVTPTVIHTANLIYQVHSGQIEDIIEVRDNGAVVAVTKDLGNGRFSLLNSPFGTITCSVQGAKWGTPTPVYSSKLGALVQHLLESYGRQILTSDINTATFTAFDAATQADIGVFLNQRENLLDLCQRLLSSVGGYLVCGLDGKFKLTQLKTDYTEGSQQYSVSPTDMEERSLAIAQKIPVKSSIKLNYNKNWTVQNTGLAGGLKPDVVDVFAREYYSTTATDSVVKEYYDQLAEPVAKDTALLTTAAATTEATRQLNIYKTPRFIYKATYLSHLLPCELGDVVKLTHPRFGLSSGKFGTAVQIERDWLNGRVTIGILV